MNEASCSFCAEIKGIESSSNLFLKSIKPVFKTNSRIVYETDNFFVMPTIGAFVEGYFLAVSKEHHACIGRMDETGMSELIFISEIMKDFIERTYRKGVVFFEHGAVSCSDLAGGCVDHAHLHIVPYDGRLRDYITSNGMETKRIYSIYSLKEIASGGQPYLYWRDVDGEEYVVINQFIPSQLFRRVIADSYGLCENWDWREQFYLDKMFRSYDTAVRYFAHKEL